MSSSRPFEEVVRAHGTTVFRVCRAVLGPADAEDAWSETFLAALRAYPDLDAGANVEAWLVTIAHRKAIDVARAHARAPVPVADPAEHPTDADTNTNTDTNPDENPDLWDALRSLPTKQRQAVAYHHLAGLPHKEVARILGGTVEAARRASSDGIRALRAALPPPSSQGLPPPSSQGENR
jgi:RNA polymerase sigma factor (sigma-70 family)